MVISLNKALTEERRIDLGRGVAIRVRPVGFARFSRLNLDALLRAQAELAGRSEGEDAPSPMAISALAQLHLDRDLIVASLTGWEGIEDETGAVAPITAETWALFAELHPDLATVAIAEIRMPGLLAAAEGNASAPSPDGDAAGAPNTAGVAPISPTTRASPAPATAATGPARKTSTARSPKTA